MTGGGGKVRPAHRREGHNGAKALSISRRPGWGKWGAPPLGVPHAPAPQPIGKLHHWLEVAP